MARPGGLETAENLLAGGLGGGALPRLETIQTAYDIRAARGGFEADGSSASFCGVQLGPLIYDLSIQAGPAGLRLGIAREVLAAVQVFAAPVLAWTPADPRAASLQDDCLRLAGDGAVAVVRAARPMQWRQTAGQFWLEMDDRLNELDLRVLPAGVKKGTVHIAFEPA